MEGEFIRSMNTNYERIALEQEVQENKYQYCILSRGGIKGLLPSSLRYLDGMAYLYYDITSKQNVTQLYAKRYIQREWIQDFVWSIGQIQKELARFLLDERNIIWSPNQIFQDIESNIFSFLYIPYYEGDNKFMELLEYLIEHIDYEDENLVECVYKMYDQYEKNGELYLQKNIFEDVEKLEELSKPEEEKLEVVRGEEQRELLCCEKSEKNEIEKKEQLDSDTVKNHVWKKGIRSLWDGKRRKQREEVEEYRELMEMAMEGSGVAEETNFGEDFGKTLYIEERTMTEVIHKIYATDGRVLIQLEKDSYTIGKKKNEVDFVLEDFSVSRMHARIVREEKEVYLEDLNSTNGTYINKVRMQPYEKVKLEMGDLIRIGKTELIYR